MPLLGVRPVEPLLRDAATLTDTDVAPLLLPRVDVLQVMYEIESADVLDLLVPALHATIPSTVTFVFWHAADGPLGPFTLAQVRAGCRAGVRPRGLPLASYIDSEQASEALRSRWGFNCVPGGVRLRRYHDRATGTVEVGGREILKVQMIDPQPISGADVQYTANMNLARLTLDGETRPWLVQVDPEFTFHRAERGKPQLTSFDPAAWQAEGMRPVFPVSATVTSCDITLPALRYISDPERPALQGTVTLKSASPNPRPLP
jgi:hypothetical protein